MQQAAEYIEPMLRHLTALPTLLTRLLHQVPSRCAVCHTWPARPVCEACVARFAQPHLRCRTCALPVPTGVTQCGACIRQPPPLDACHAAVGYTYPWSQLIVEFKFRQQPGWAEPLALLLRSTPWVEAALEQADDLLPIPLTPQRLQARGFNQARELARHLAPDKLRTNWLLRVRDTADQHTLPRAERLDNMRHAFAIDPQWRDALRGRRVVLLDDVMTSGATLAAAAQALRDCGVAHITGLVLARTA